MALHHQIGDDNVVLTAIELGHRLGTAVGDVAFMANTHQRLAHHMGVVLLVVDHEYLRFFYVSFNHNSDDLMRMECSRQRRHVGSASADALSEFAKFPQTRPPRRTLQNRATSASECTHGNGALATNGKSSVKIDPFPGSLATVILPPCSSAMRREMARPRPVPPFFVEK